MTIYFWGSVVTTHFQIRPARVPEDMATAAELFRGYAASLPVALDYQDFGAELAGLPGKYAAPKGELLIAWGGDGEALGVVGLRPIRPDGACEMKRLYLLPAARGMGLGRAMTEAVIAAARARGYGELRLDTLASMQAAQRLYEQMGFERIPPYYEPTPPGTIFMRLSL
jgi:ribosomal protein S18 acetylase RimI-like enzyme